MITQAQEPRRFFFIFGLTSWALVFSVVIGSTSVILPAEVQKHSAQANALKLGVIIGVGAGIQLIGLFSSFFSDRCTSSLGRRRPFILTGGVLVACGCSLMFAAIFIANLVLLVAGFFLASAGISIGFPALQSLVPDLLPQSQIGLGSGVLGIWSALGSGSGFGLMALGIENKWIMLAFVFVALAGTTTTLLVAKESRWTNPVAESSKQSCSMCASVCGFFKAFAFDVRKHPDFVLLLVQKLLSAFAISSLMFQQLWLADILHRSNPQVDASRIALSVFAVNLIVSPVAGHLADKTGKPKYLLLSGFLFSALSHSFYTFIRDFRLLWVSAALGGLAMGLKMTTDFPILVSVMPVAGSPAKFLSMLTFCLIAGQLIASQILGAVLESFATGQKMPAYTTTGYIAAYSIAVGADLVASLLVLLINVSRGHKAQILMSTTPTTITNDSTPLLGSINTVQ